MADLRTILSARERQLRFVARLSATGGWALELNPLRFHPSIEWLELHGWDADDRPSLHQALRNVPRADRVRLLQALRACVATGEPVDVAVRVRHRAGHTVCMRMISEAAPGDDGRITRLDGACQDVTTQVRREHELEVHRDRLEELVDQRTRDLQTFSHALAHDLRAPIAAMAGFAQVVAERGSEQLDSQSRHRLERIVANAHRAEALIDGILGLVSQLQAPLRKEPVDVTNIAQAAIEQQRSLQPQREVETLVQEHMAAQGDPRLLMSVVGNLVSNAWKFTSRRSDARVEVGQIGDATFYVKDNGVGFDSELSGQLFQPLQRLHTDKEFTGLGIGLAAAYRIVLRHGGRMWADSAPGAGATFWFTLPADEVIG